MVNAKVTPRVGSVLTGNAALDYAERFKETVQMADVKDVTPARARELLAKAKLQDRARLIAAVTVRITEKAIAS